MILFGFSLVGLPLIGALIYIAIAIDQLADFSKYRAYDFLPDQISSEPYLADRLKRAEKILRTVISLQDRNPDSRTYGIWSWFAEEPLDKMSPPDWNWADFCGTQLLQVAIDHKDRLPADLPLQGRPLNVSVID